MLYRATDINNHVSHARSRSIIWSCGYKVMSYKVEKAIAPAPLTPVHICPWSMLTLHTLRSTWANCCKHQERLHSIVFTDLCPRLIDEFARQELLRIHQFFNRSRLKSPCVVISHYIILASRSGQFLPFSSNLGFVPTCLHVYVGTGASNTIPDSSGVTICAITARWRYPSPAIFPRVQSKSRSRWRLL